MVAHANRIATGGCAHTLICFTDTPLIVLIHFDFYIHYNEHKKNT